jgi:glycosyltransferase involved in cell wall biosynthesis
MRDLVFVSLERWDRVWRRNQFLCAQWLRRFPRMRLLFVEPPRDLSHAVRTGRFATLKSPADDRVPDFPGLSLFRPLKVCPNTLGAGRVANALLLRFQIRAAMQRAGLRNPILWINDHFAGHLAGTLCERGVVYDITDDWCHFPSASAGERLRIEQADRHLCAKANVVVVCSEALEKSRRPLSRRLIRIPNGVDPQHYALCRTQNSFGKRGGRLAGPVFGYAGTLHGDRLDLELISRLAREFPLGKVVLCGPDFLSAAEREKLASHSNVEVRPAVAYAKVPRVISEWDVCIVPHKKTPFTESLNPIKLWEYLASGKPIAGTPVAGFRDYPHLCHLGEGVEGFLGACRRALNEEAWLPAERVRAVEGHSWEARAEDALDVFRQEGWIGPAPRRSRLRDRRRERVGLAGGLQRVFWRDGRACSTAGAPQM